MTKKITIAALALVVLLAIAGGTYYATFDSNYKTLQKFEQFVVPKDAVLATRDDQKLVFKTTEMNKKGPSWSYRTALKKAKWKEFKRQKDKIIYEKDGHFIEVTVGEERMSVGKLLVKK